MAGRQEAPPPRGILAPPSRLRRRKGPSVPRVPSVLRGVPSVRQVPSVWLRRRRVPSVRRKMPRVPSVRGVERVAVVVVVAGAVLRDPRVINGLKTGYFALRD